MIQKTILGALLASALCAGAWAAETQALPTQTFKVAAGGELQFRSYQGDIAIRLWDRDEITVAARGIDARDLKIEPSGNLVRMDYRGRGHDVRFDLQVPTRFNLNLSTGGGDIRVSGDLQGNLEVETQGGDVTFGDIRGEARVKSSGGDIRGGAIAGNSEIRTLGGDIALGQIDGTLGVTSQGGDISIRGVGSTLTAKTFGGDIEVGDVGGQAELNTLGGDVLVGRVSGKADLKTSGGDIELRSSTGDVIASTAGGDIVLRDVSGSVEAQTAGGDIDAEVVTSSVGGSSLVSRGGDVSLRLPADARVTVQAKIRLRGSSGRRSEHRIVSDFPQTTAESAQTESEISATYAINGGGPVITLETTNGSIKIRKGAR